MNLREWLKNVDSSLDSSVNLSRRFPGYFNRWVFRGGFALIVLYIVAAGFSVDWKWSGRYAECVGSSPCNYYDSCVPVCKDGNPLCVETCKPLLLMPGESVGSRPSWLVSHYLESFAGIIAAAFIVNHALYKAYKVRS